MANAVQKIGNDDVEKFIINAPYGKKGAFPSSKGAAIILSTVEIDYVKCSPNILKEECKTKITNIHKNGEFRDHAEGRFCEMLKNQIQSHTSNGYKVSKIQAKLVQNYSPCNNYRPDGKSGCTDDIVDYINELQGVDFDFTIQFANFYEHYKPSNREGLKKLLRNGVVLELLPAGEATSWEAFLDDDTFMELSDGERNGLLARAESQERKDREEIDTKMLDMLRKEESALDGCHYDWPEFLKAGGDKNVAIKGDLYRIVEEDEGTSSEISDLAANLGNVDLNGDKSEE